MKHYVIHDTNRKDRLELFLKECYTQGIKEVGFMPSITAPKPALGISIAHRNCILDAKRNGYSECLIMEDDVKFTHPNSYNRFLELYKNVPQEADIFLSGISTGTLKPYTDGISRVGEFSALHCYIVRSKFYDKFLTAPKNKHIDRWLGSAFGAKANVFVADPILAIQHSGYSDNKKQVKDYSYLFNRYNQYNG